jgi:hypothetical protein
MSIESENRDMQRCIDSAIATNKAVAQNIRRAYYTATTMLYRLGDARFEMARKMLEDAFKK